MSDRAPEAAFGGRSSRKRRVLASLILYCAGIRPVEKTADGNSRNAARFLLFSWLYFSVCERVTLSGKEVFTFVLKQEHGHMEIGAMIIYNYLALKHFGLGRI